MDKTTRSKRGVWSEGEPFVWLTGAALSVTLITVAVLIFVVVQNGFAVFWPSNLVEMELADGSHVMGVVMKREDRPNGEGRRVQIKTGNRELYGMDFRWINESDIAATTYPEDAVALEREENGNFYGRLKALPGEEDLPADLAQLQAVLADIEERTRPVEEVNKRVAALSTRMERGDRRLKKLRYKGAGDEDEEVVAEEARLSELGNVFHQEVEEQTRLVTVLRSEEAVFADVSGTEKPMVLMDIVRAYQPNTMSLGAKTVFYGRKIGELLFDDPRESNTEGGLFPAIFGTIMLTFLMCLLSFPLGLLGGIYLREYAKEGLLVRIVRIAVNNLAGIPSIVYGIFGLGFFVYGIGGTIDKLFFPERLPMPTFGTGGILWAGLTLGLLTVPVVIVATEEALGAIPKGVHEGAYAMGATKFQTLTRVLLPMASPGIMTGFILAMARAAGEVAPLMITGVVKLAPALPLDGQYPFMHFDRKFMHLGFHIYDIGFQSPNVEAAKPMVFVTTLLLVLIVLVMSSVAIYLRNSMRRRYSVSRL